VECRLLSGYVRGEAIWGAVCWVGMLAEWIIYANPSLRCNRRYWMQFCGSTKVPNVSDWHVMSLYSASSSIRPSVPNIHSFCSSASGESLNCLRESAVWEGEMVLGMVVILTVCYCFPRHPQLLSYTHRPIPLYTDSRCHSTEMYEKNFA